MLSEKSSENTESLRRISFFLPLLWGFGAWIGSHFSAESILRLMSRLPLRCPLHAWTGYLCPTCGLGRSLVLAFSGYYRKSLHYHPGGLLVYGLSIAVFFAFLAGRPVLLWKLGTAGRRVGWTALLVYALWGFSRNWF
jgi:hypothetical protein